MIRKDKEKIMIREDKNIIVWQRVKSLKKKIIQERNKKRKGEKIGKKEEIRAAKSKMVISKYYANLGLWNIHPLNQSIFMLELKTSLLG